MNKLGITKTLQERLKKQKDPTQECLNSRVQDKAEEI